jgi:hypothetical protein
MKPTLSEISTGAGPAKPCAPEFAHRREPELAGRFVAHLARSGRKRKGRREAALPVDAAIPVAYGPKKLITRANTSAR